MPGKPELKIPEDYKEPLDKEIIWRLDQLPDNIREKEIEIIGYNARGQEQNQILNERSDLILSMMRREKKYVEGTNQFQQVHTSRMLIDDQARKAREERSRLNDKIKTEKIELNYLLNKFKGSQGIAQRKISLEK